jgi:Zn ribbon nucleic-acid-binding protein
LDIKKYIVAILQTLHDQDNFIKLNTLSLSLKKDLLRLSNLIRYEVRKGYLLDDVGNKNFKLFLHSFEKYLNSIYIYFSDDQLLNKQFKESKKIIIEIAKLIIKNAKSKDLLELSNKIISHKKNIYISANCPQCSAKINLEMYNSESNSIDISCFYCGSKFHYINGKFKRKIVNNIEKEKIKEQIKNSLPTYPFPKFIHREIADKFNVTNSFVYSIIREIINDSSDAVD